MFKNFNSNKDPNKKFVQVKQQQIFKYLAYLKLTSFLYVKLIKQFYGILKKKIQRIKYA